MKRAKIVINEIYTMAKEIKTVLKLDVYNQDVTLSREYEV